MTTTTKQFWGWKSFLHSQELHYPLDMRCCGDIISSLITAINECLPIWWLWIQLCRCGMVYIGNRALRGLSLNDKRFDNINKDPSCSSNIKNSHLPNWKYISDRQIDFKNVVYNRNVYKPKTSLVNRRFEIGHASMSKKIGRNEQPIGDYCLA